MRLKVFLGAFLGYAAYYLVRKNLSLAAPSMIEEGLLDKAGVSFAMTGIPVAYAFSKFIMGSLSDRSDARKFLVVGLILASLVMMSVGLLPLGQSIGLNSALLFGFMLAAGWISGMGWPPCGRIMAHWFSQRERSFKMSIWNTSHNVGGGSLGVLALAGVAVFGMFGIEQTWRAAFIFPSLVALLLALLGLHFYMQRAVNDLVPERPEDEEYLRGRINVLVVGTDAEEYDSGRADSIIVFNLDLDNKRVHALSIPRDSRVDIPGYKNKTKINHSYAYGGIELTKQTVENLLHVPIDYYAVTNFAGFEDIVETVGGVYIDVPIRMRTHTWYGDIDLQPGFQHLDGKSALAYVRWRGTATADIGRIERQQNF